MSDGDFSDILADPRPKAAASSGKASHAVAGTTLHVMIFAENWDNPNQTETLDCGTFEVCGMQINGPPSTARIEGVSVPLSAPVRREKHTRAWEETTLKSIASDIADRGGLTLTFDLDDDPVLDRVDQRQEPDLLFLMNLAMDHGASVKVYDKQLVIFSEAKYEAKPSVITFMRGDKRLKSYTFTQDTSDVAEGAVATYKDPKSGKWVSEEFYPPDAPAVGNQLIVNARPWNMEGDRYRELLE